MKTIRLLMLTMGLFAFCVVSAQQTYMKITLDTKSMSNLDCSLGGGGGIPSNASKVYAHLGLCTCNMLGTGATATRDCSNPTLNQQYCLEQIKPYKSNVWQHVVGNWGDFPQDDGIGLMTSEGNGVYFIEFIIEEYFTNPAIVSTASEGTDVVNSIVWNPAQGGQPYTIGMVFRNEDATLSGRDDLCMDLFIVNLQTNPMVIQGSDPSSDFPAITFMASGIKDAISKEKVLSTAYPNPFNDQCRIRFLLNENTENLRLDIFSIKGALVHSIDAGSFSAGVHEIEWEGTGNNGKRLPNGLYSYSIITGNTVHSTNKIVLTP